MTHEFKFNQQELENLVRVSGLNNIAVTFCGLKGYGGDRTFYLCAISMKAISGQKDVMNTLVRPIIGCPYPPLWRDNLEFIPHDILEVNPKFIFSAAQLAQLLPQNQHTPAPGTDKLISAEIDARAQANGDLETFVSFIMKDAAGNPVGNPVVGLTQ